MPRQARNKARTAQSAAPEVPTLRELLERTVRGPWRDVKAYASLLSNVRFLNERLGDTLVPAITAETLENFADQMRNQGYAPATIKRRLATLSRALKQAVTWGIIPAAPTMPPLTVRNTKDRVLEWREEGALLNELASRHIREPWRHWHELYRLVVVLVDTAARLSEVLAFQPGDLVEIEGKSYLKLHRYQTKNDKPRTIPLTDRAANALRGPAWTLTAQQAWRLWDQARGELGLQDVTLHTLRHTALTRLAQGGMDLIRLQKWAGHSDPRITAERYTHLVAADLLGGLDILERTTT